MVPVAVNGGREPDDRRVDAAVREGDRRVSVGQPLGRAAGQVGTDRAGLLAVLLGRDPSRRQPECAGGDEEGAVGAGERLAERVDGTPVRFGGVLEAAAERDVVLEGEVDHAVGVGSRAAQRVEIVERAAAYLGAGFGEGVSRGVRAGEPDDLVAGADEFRNNG